MKFTTKIKNKLESKGYLVINLIKASDSGYPDLMAFHKTDPDLFIELKTGLDSLKAVQKYRIDELIKIDKNAVCLHETKGIIYPEIVNEKLKSIIN